MEQRFEEIRKKAGFVLAPLTFCALYFSPLEGLTKIDKAGTVIHNQPAHALAAIMATTAVLWICESLPMVVTALAAAGACCLLGVEEPKAVFAPFADTITFLFIGSFILAQAVFA